MANSKLKSDLKIGPGYSFIPRGSREVEVIASENHPIWGKRYKVNGYDEWFEENAFEYVIFKEDKPVVNN